MYKMRRFIVISTLFAFVIVLCCFYSFGRYTPSLYFNEIQKQSSPRRTYKFLFCSCQRIVNVTTETFVFKSLHFIGAATSSPYCHDNGDDNNGSMTPSSLSTSQHLFKRKLGEFVHSNGGWDVVVFNVHDMPGPTTLKRIRASVPEHQLWAYYNRESPYNSINLIKKKFDGIFNLTMTPLRQSDVMTKYGYYRKRRITNNANDGDFIKVITDDFSTAKRNRSLVWVSSHCNIQRDVLIAALSRYVNIDIYGKCARKFKQYQRVDTCVRFASECEQKLRRYKFGIAFENSLCQDYVTEKYWDAIYRGSIPVVHGGSRYDAKLVIPGSFIDAKSFKSVRDLAMHLQHVSTNRDAYLQYHRWRRDYVIDYDPKDRHRFDIVGGKLVKLLRSRETNGGGGFKKKVYKLSSFYSRRKHCEVEKRI